MLDYSGLHSYGYSEWFEHFVENKKQVLAVDFSQEGTLTESEKALLYPSIADFQRGEASEGKHLIAASERFARTAGQPAYADTIKLFIEEENQHSAYLQEFMQFHGMKLKKASVLDGVFRLVRKVKGIYSEVTVLVSAEIIAISHYEALRNATSSPALKSICEKILRDETPHIAFQTFTLSLFPQSRITRPLRRGLMAATCLVVWASYRKLFRAGGYSLRRLFRDSMRILEQSISEAETLRASTQSHVSVIQKP